MSFRIPNSEFRIRKAYTLAELLIATVASSVLLAALGSTMFIASKVAYTPVHAQKLLDGTNTASALVDELKHATYVVDHGATFVEFVTADRDSDDVEDTIRYEWSGVAGDPLTRSFNRGTPTDVLDEVHQFQLDYTFEQASEELEVLTAGSELQLDPQYASSSSFNVKPNKHVSQKVNLSGLPASAESWSLTRIQFEASQSGSADAQLAVQLRYASANGSPTSEVVAQFIVDESALSATGGWYTLAPAQPVTGLSPHRNYCIVFAWLSGGDAAKISFSNSAVGAYETNDNGASWETSNKWAQVIVFAKADSPGTPLAIHGDRLRSVAISLQHGDSGLARIDTAVALDNEPILVDKAWRTDFEADPTAQDANGDGEPDFIYSGGAFDPSSIADGVWQASNSLRVNHTGPISTPVVVDLRGRSLGAGGKGLLARTLLRRSASEHVDVSLSLVREADGTQTARLVAFDGSASSVLTTVRELPATSLDVRLTVAPSRQLAALRVQGVDYPVAVIPTVSASIANDSMILTEDISNAEFDYASFQITTDIP